MAMSVPSEHCFFNVGLEPPALGFETAFIYYHNFRTPAKLRLKQDETGQRMVCFESHNHELDVWLSSGWHGKWSSYIREGGIIHLHVTFNCRGHNDYQHNLHLTYDKLGWWRAFQRDEEIYEESTLDYQGRNSPVSIRELTGFDTQVSIIVITTATIDILKIIIIAIIFVIVTINIFIVMHITILTI